MMLQGKKILLGLTGGIACYKVAELCRALVKAGAQVQVVMTEAATQFITPVTMQALSGRDVFSSQWDARAADDNANNMAHINLGRWADAILIAPASADFMAKLLHGRADELLSLTCLARPVAAVPLVVAPAMNREMWLNPATQRNVAQLKADGITVLDVGNGDQACGETGDGRMLEAHEILADLEAFFTPKRLAGKRVLVTAGPTFEPLDPVRGITNRSSGKMGYAIATAAAQTGAAVTLVSGPVALAAPRGVRRISVETAQDMLQAVLHSLQTEPDSGAPSCDVFIACAAVADWRAAHIASAKIKKDGSGLPLPLEFVENPDILAYVAKNHPEVFCVGFAAESEDLLTHASAKRVRKGVPLLVGNLGPATFGQDDNALLLIDAQGHRELPKNSKAALAAALVADIAERLG